MKIKANSDPGPRVELKYPHLRRGAITVWFVPAYGADSTPQSYYMRLAVVGMHKFVRDLDTADNNIDASGCWREYAEECGTFCQCVNEWRVDRIIEMMKQRGFREVKGGAR